MNINRATQYDIDKLKASADIIIEESAEITWLGICAPGTVTTAEAAWSICKIEQTAPDTDGNIITVKWASGQCAYNLVFDDRANYSYYFKKF